MLPICSISQVSHTTHRFVLFYAVAGASSLTARIVTVRWYLSPLFPLNNRNATVCSHESDRSHHCSPPSFTMNRRHCSFVF
ncbi:hypothetical protein HanIR_Chr05g0234481 [Helianthus annuus]|nr:hypothetical protein HanIR_Chr05g0234481 [Helianthus annuus]